MDLQLIGIMAPVILSLITGILKKYMKTSGFASMAIVFIVGGVATLVGVGPSPGATWLDKTLDAGWLIGGATLVFNIYKQIKIPKKILGDAAKCIVAGIFATALLASCASLQTGAIQAGQLDLKNAEATRALAKNLLSTWKLNSGFIRGALGPKLGELPQQAVAAMDELDKLAEKTEPNDFDLGWSLGGRIRMLGAIVQAALKLYAPDVLQYLPSVLAF